MKINLNCRYYTRAAIEEALKDYREVCQGRILDETFSVELRPREDIENIQEEFSNYVLALMRGN